MPLKMICADITTLTCDAVVNAANETLLGGGGVDGAIHKAAGKELLAECKTLGGCKTGEAKITNGYRLPCKYVIHTVGPVWHGGENGEEALLRSCYRNAFALAREYRCESVAFPLISSGAYRYPKEQALFVAVDEISRFLSENEMLVCLVIYDKAAYRINENLASDISAFIDEKYVGEKPVLAVQSAPQESEPLLDSECAPAGAQAFFGRISGPASAAPRKKSAPRAKETSLQDALKQLDESFSEMLLRKIDEKGMTDAECYKKANIDRKLFSKIRSDKYYKPSKTTAIAFSIALELPLAETKELLMKAGFALSHSSKFDIIIEYFITNRNYNIFEINEALFAFDQALLGG
ncbi:MAG: macro domain-containing protein [Clostridia bacterium]|nr:macro domain-containing protein [Clostridia bacterium]